MRDKTVDVSASVRELLGTLESQRRQHDSDQRIIAELRGALTEGREQIQEMLDCWDTNTRPGLWQSNSLGVIDRIDAALKSSGAS